MTSLRHFTPEQFFRGVLGISVRQGHRIISRGEIGIVRIGRAIRIPEAEADRFLAERFIAAKTEIGRRRPAVLRNVASIVDGIIPAHRLGPHIRIPVDSAIRAMQPVGKAKGVRR